MKLKATKIYPKIKKAFEKGFRNIVLQGGARSGKTVALAQFIALLCLGEWAFQNKIITIARKTFPALRGSVMRDFFWVLQTLGIYSDKDHNKTTNEYSLAGNLIEFVAVDQPQKIRGRKRNIAWLNEANEFEYDDFFQLNIRTSDRVFFDYNPSDEFHWIYDRILTREDTAFIKSTFRDNPFLAEELRKEIEALKDQDENLWRIYGLGEVGKARDLVYTNWDVVDSMPHICDHYRYGLDFGYNHPTALVFEGIKGNDLYVQEMIYQTGLTNQDLIDLMNALEISKKVLIRADSAEPDRIVELQRAGFTVEGVKKGRASVKDRIDSLKRRKIHIIKGSENLLKEIKNYRYQKDQKTGFLKEEPVKFKDDLMDAMAYGVGDIIVDSRLFNEAVEGSLFRKDLPRRSIDHYSLTGRA